MPIVCPHCTTSYAVDAAKLGPEGRTVRCARCKAVWLARPDDDPQHAARALVAAMATGSHAPLPAIADPWPEPHADLHHPPQIDSPSIAGDMPADGDWAVRQDGDIIDAQADETPVHRRIDRRGNARGRRARDAAGASRASSGLRIACVAMAAMLAAILIWRGGVVRLLPQTAAFYKALGLEVNLRGLAFKDIKLSNETVDGKSVLVIEGNIVATAKKPVEVPRLRFVVRDTKGTEIYGWNAVLEQAALKPGETAWFRSRLAAPPAEGQTLDVRFFNRRDLAAGLA